MAPMVPEQWRTRVCFILDSGDYKRIKIRQRALVDWSALFPALFTCDLLSALSDALKDPELMGNQVLLMQEPGETYEFIFTYSGRRVYSKINLSPDGSVVIIYSAHRPLKGETL
jgi:hypothetical protein